MSTNGKPIVGWMTWPDYQMFTNEQPEGGFKWEFLDFKPESNQEDLKDFNTPIFIYKQTLKASPISEEEIESLKAMIKLWEERNLENVSEIERLKEKNSFLMGEKANAMAALDLLGIPMADEIIELKKKLTVAKNSLEMCLNYLEKRGIRYKGTTGRTVVLPSIDEALRQIGEVK